MLTRSLKHSHSYKRVLSAYPDVFKHSFHSEVDKKVESKPSSSIIPGIVASVAGCGFAFTAADYIGKALLSVQNIEFDPDHFSSPISGIPVAIILGMLVGNLSPKSVTEKLLPGAQLASKRVLQTGIVCVGLKLSAVDLVTTGLVGLPAVAASVGVALYVVPKVGKALKLPDKMSYLIAAGTSICGITAISALSPSINATKTDTSIAVANVVTFGTVALLTYPYLAHNIMTSSQQIGMFLGLAIHDTS